MHIKPLGNLGQVQLVAADVRKPASVARAVADVDAVVNLVGSFENMDAVQHVGAGNVASGAAAAVAATGVSLESFVSAIPATQHTEAGTCEVQAGE